MASRWGLTLPLPATPLADSERRTSRRAEAAGYTDIWSGETNGPDGFTPLALCSQWTEKARLGTGVVGVLQRGRALLAQEAAALADASGGRFALGIGASSDRIVEGWNGMPFERRCSKVSRDDRLPAHGAGRRARRRRLQARDRAGRGDADHRRGPARQDAASSRSRRATARSPTSCPSRACPRWPSSSTGAPEGFELLCRFFCLPGEREQVEPLARFMFSSYITVPVYENFYRWLGHGEKIDEMVEAWAAKDRQKAAEARALGPDRGHVHPRLARGDEGAARRLRRGRHHAAGADADHDARDRLGELIEALAPS